MNTFSGKHSTAADPKTASRRAKSRPLKILDRYVLRCLAASTLRGLLWFGGLLVTVAVITAARQISDKSLPLSSLVQLVSLQFPRVFLFTLPMAVLYGTTEAFTELSSSGELTAMLAAGTDRRQLIQMPILWGIALAVLSFCVQDFLMPRAETAKNALVARSVTEAMGTGSLRYYDPPLGKGALRRIVQAQSFDPKTNVLTRPVVQFLDENQKLTLQISAERGVWNRDTNQWSFQNGKLTTFPRQKPNAPGESSTRTRPSSTISGGKIESLSLDFAELKRGDTPAPGILRGAEKSLRQHLEHGDFEVVSFAQLWDYRAQMQTQSADGSDNKSSDGKSSDDRARDQTLIRGLTYGLHDKIATPLICIALVLIGLPLGLRPPRAGTGFAVGSSLVVLLGYYSLWTWTQASGAKGQGNPALWAYLGPLVVASVGTTLLWRKRL